MTFSTTFKAITRSLFAIGLMAIIALSMPALANAQCTTPTAPGGGDNVAGVDTNGRGAFFTADCTGNVYSVSFNIANPFGATTAEVHLYSDRPSGTLGLMAQQSFVPVAGLNTVVIGSMPLITSGNDYTFVVTNADATMDVEQLVGGANGVSCTGPLPGSPGTCSEPGANEIPFSIQFPTPELEMTDSFGDFASNDMAPADTNRDFDDVEVGDSFQQTISVRNDGTGILNVSGITFGDVTAGAGAMFSAWPPSFWVGVGQTYDITVTFTPTDAGTHVATMAIASDDADENPTSFHLTGNGLMDLGDAPGAQSVVATNGARHALTGPQLGALRDGESDGGAGLNNDADDDGVTFLVNPAQFIAGSTVAIDVNMQGSGGAYLQAWLDSGDGTAPGTADGTFQSNQAAATFAADEMVLTNEYLVAGSNLINLDIPAGSSGAMALRFRVSTIESDTGTYVEEDGPVGNGEVEDYEVTVLAGASNSTIVNLTTEEMNVAVSGGNLVFTDANGIVIMSAPISGMASGGMISVNGTSGDNTLTLESGVVDALLANGIVIDFDGTIAGYNSIVIEDGLGTFDDVTHVFTNNTTGTVSVADGGPLTTVLTYKNLAPILDNMSAISRTFDFTSALDEVITLSANGDGASGNGVSFIDSDVGGESVSFTNPTTNITITSTGGGADTYNLGLLDTPVPLTFVMLTVDGGSGPELFNVTPSTAYGVDVDGGLPSGVCPGDALIIDLSGGAVIDTVTNVMGTGSVTFSSGHSPVTFTEIESFGDGDVEISANYEVIYATQDLTTAAGTALVITATNSGPNDVNCITVDIDAALADWLAAANVTFTPGTSFADPTWSIPTLAVGASATLTIEGFVINGAPQDVLFTSNATQDTNASNDVATVELSMGFTMPAKTQVNAALYLEKTVSGGGTYESLIVGIWGGAPGITGAVWCKIPDVAVGGVWPPASLPLAAIGDHWRPCSKGLPFPLHPMDLYEDTAGTLWMAVWGSAGLYKSTNQGESWEAAWPGIGPGNASTGTYWTQVYTIVEDAAGGILYTSANDGYVLRSLNGGTTWQQVGSLPWVDAHTPWSMVAHPSISGVVYAGTFGSGIYYSEDYGFTWSELDDAGTVANENQDLIAAFGGHIFDMEFSPDADFLYAATGKGVWRADLTAGVADFTGAWTFMGPGVTLDDLSVAVPEARTLAFVGDGPGGGIDALVVGTWGFGAFEWANPNGSTVFSPLVLKEGQVKFVAVSPSGVLYLGLNDGTTVTTSLSSGTSTANEPVKSSELPEGFSLNQNYPNPFNPVTTIGFALPESGRVRLSVFDTLGREVAVLVDGQVQAGQHEVQFSAAGLPTGTYLYRLDTGAGAIARTLVLMK